MSFYSKINIYKASEIIRDFQSYKNLNSFITDFYVYFRNSDTVLTCGGKHDPVLFYEGIYSFGEQPYEKWHNDTVKQYYYGEFSKTLTQHSGRGEYRSRMLTYMKSMSIGDHTNPYATISILVDEQSVNNLLRNMVDHGNAYILDDNTLFMFPFFRLETPLRVNWGPQMRKDWLDKVGMKAPVNINEWYNVLKAFKEKDPNGNGQPDEIPLVSQGVARILNLAPAWGIRSDFYVKNGKMGFGPLAPEFKDFIITMSKWYKEGLIDPDYLATDGKGYNDNNDYARLTPGNGAAITPKCKYQVEAAKWLDFHYSEQGNLLMNFGIEGESYKMENGFPRYTDLILKNPQGLAPTNALGRYGRCVASGPIMQDVRYVQQFREEQKQLPDAEKIWGTSDAGLFPPPVTPTPEESTRVATIMNEVNTYVSEKVNKFIMGIEPLDGYDRFVADIKNMGVEEAIKIQQAALDRYNARK